MREKSSGELEINAQIENKVHYLFIIIPVSSNALMC